MSTPCMQSITQQLDDMPMDEFEDLLKGAAVNKGHEGRPQHAELLRQLKHHTKVPPDEPIQTKATDKDCTTFWKSYRQDKSHRLTNNSNSGCSNVNGNASVGDGNHNSHYNYHQKHSSSFGSNNNPSTRHFPGGDQNANPLSSTSDTTSSTVSHHHLSTNRTHGKPPELSNHYLQNHVPYGNSMDGDPGGLVNRRSHDHERDLKNMDNNVSLYSTTKNSYNTDDEDQDDDPEIHIGSLPAQYHGFHHNKDFPILYGKASSSMASSSGPSQPASTAITSSDNAATSSASWDLQTPANSHLQLNDGWKSVSSLTSGVPSYMGRLSANEDNARIIGTVSPGPNSIVSKSPSFEGSQFEKPQSRRAGDRKKKTPKNVLRETVINPENMPGWKGGEDLQKILDFVEGNPESEKPIKPKDKKPQKEKKKDPKAKGTDKQLLSKAASLDENSLGYGSKKDDDGLSKNRNGKDVEKNNSTNITKSSSAICSVEIANSEKQGFGEQDGNLELPEPKSNIVVNAAPLINGAITDVPKTTAAKIASPSSKKPFGAAPKSQIVTGKRASSESPEAVPTLKSELPENNIEVKSVPKAPKTDDEKFSKPDESDGPYVLVQSKKKREKKKCQQRESENFARSHVDQSRREGGRARRSNTERRKSVGSVPGSENSECSDDDDSVRSLPAGECTPRERIPKPCSSSGGTPQTSYADIARMSRDETGKAVPIPLPPVVAKSQQTVAKPPPETVSVTPSDSTNFPALSPPNTTEKTTPSGAALWPCRRPELDGSSREKSPSNSRSEENRNESSPPMEPSLQQTSVDSIPPTCSKLVFESKESTPQDKIVKEKVPGKDISPAPVTTSVPSVQVNGPQQEQKDIHNKPNGILQPSNTFTVGTEHLSLTSSSRILVNKKLEDKKAKDKSIKYDEAATKINSAKLVENGDSGIVLTAPVVFCGGKFDGSNLPVGQKSGFEFGFGVIEALNDTSGGIAKNDCSFVRPSSADFPPITAISNNDKSELKQIGSQENPATQTNESKSGSQTLKNDQISNSGEKQNNKNGQVARAKENLVSNNVTATGAGKPSQGGHSVLQQAAKQLVETGKNTPTLAETTKFPKPASQSANQLAKATTLTQKVSASIAQIYMPPNPVIVPDSVHQVAGFMDNYITRLGNLHKEGKISYHRLD